MKRSDYISLSFLISAIALFCIAGIFDCGIYHSLLICFGVICFLCTIGSSVIIQRELNRAGMVVIVLFCVLMTIGKIFETIEVFINGDWTVKLTFIIIFGSFFGIIIFLRDTLFPAIWLRLKLSSIYGNKTCLISEEQEDINGKKNYYINARYDNHGILYTYYPQDKCLHISRRLFLDPLQHAEERDTLIAKTQKRVEELQLPVPLIFAREKEIYAYIVVVIKKRDASEETLRSLRTILCELNDTESHVYILAVFQTEAWFIEAYGLSPIWSAVDVYELEIPEGVDRSEYIVRSAKYQANMILQHLYNGTTLDDEPGIRFMSKEEMIQLSPEYADYVEETEHADLQNTALKHLILRFAERNVVGRNADEGANNSEREGEELMINGRKVRIYV